MKRLNTGPEQFSLFRGDSRDENGDLPKLFLAIGVILLVILGISALGTAVNTAGTYKF